MRETLAALEDVVIVASVTDESAAVAAVRDNQVDVIVLDLQLKEGTGFGVMEQLGKARPLVIVFTNYMLPVPAPGERARGHKYFLNKSRDYETPPEIIQEIGASRLPH